MGASLLALAKSIYYLSLYLYVCNFQTGPLDAGLTYLRNLISFVIVKDMCLV